MKLLSFGEVLWDVYPNEKFIGGAPLNFACHFKKNGLEAYMLSAVGNDDLGKDTLKCITDWQVRTDHVAILDDYVTGKCLVTLNEKLVPTYNLLSDVAYDYIPCPKLGNEVFDVLYFGTLALRTSYNQQSLQELIEHYAFKEIFVDVNIRPPHYSDESIQFAFKNASMIKVSDEELPIVLKALGMKEKEYPQLSKDLCTKCPNLKVIIITQGEKGSFVYDCINGKVYECEAKKVEVASTVGAGDSFSATFLAQYLKNKPIEECLELATKVSAYVVSQVGAIPNYDLEEL